MHDTAKYDISVMMIFTIIGIVVKLFFAQPPSIDGSTGPANATIWGYGIVAMSLLCTLFIKYALSSKGVLVSTINEATPWHFIKELVQQIVPVTVVFGILAWTIILNSVYLVQINKGKVTPTYSNLSWTSTLLILFQLMLVFNIVYTALIPGEKKASIWKGQLEALSYLLGTINFVMLIIMNISLVFFSTDG